MNINLRSLKGCYICDFNSSRPKGIVRNVFRISDRGRVDSLSVDTASIVPLSYILKINSIHSIDNNIIILKKGIPDAGYIQNDLIVPPRILQPSSSGNNHSMKLRDMTFDMESGEITDITVSKSMLSKKNKLSINNIYIKDNTIYIK